MSNHFHFGSMSVKTYECKKSDNNIHQNHRNLPYFKSNVLNSKIKSIYIGWYFLPTQKKETLFSFFGNVCLGIFPFLGRKKFQHCSIWFKLENRKKVIIEYGCYDNFDNNEPYNTDIYYWNRTNYGLRLYEDPTYKYFTKNTTIKLKFNDKGKTLKELLEGLNLNKYRKKDYDILTNNCQHFVKELIKVLQAERNVGENFRGNHTGSTAIIPSELLNQLEENEGDISNAIGFVPVLGYFIDSLRN